MSGGLAAGAVVIVGATSGVGRALAAGLAREGRPLVLAGRDPAEVEATAADLRLRAGGPVATVRLEALDHAGHAAAVEACFAGGRVAAVVLCIGHLGDHAAALADAEEAHRLLETNFTASVLLAERFAEGLRAAGGGVLCALSSVAGDRGRASNYLYGAAKAGLTVHLEGLRHRLAGSGVRVVTVKLGMVDTRMSYGRPGSRLAFAPAAAARGIRRALAGGPDTVYLPRFWRWIMLGIRSIPGPLFRRLPL